MRKFIIDLALASTAAMAAPAAAQYQDSYRDRGYGYGQQGRQLEQRIYQLRERIQRVTQRGAVSRNEAIRLQRELNLIERRYQQFVRNGLTRQETYDIEQRIRNLRQQIREDRQDGRRYQDDRRYDDRGYDDNRRYDDRRDDDRRYDRDDR